MIDGWRPRWVPLLKRLSAECSRSVMLATIAWQSWLQARDAMSFGDVTSDLSLPRILYWAPLVFGIAAGGGGRRGRDGAPAGTAGDERRPHRRPRASSCCSRPLLVRVPIAVALASSGLPRLRRADGWPKALKMLGSVPFSLSTAYSLSVIPLFILMGAVASRAAMSRELFDAANALFSGFRGALTHATIGACAAFGAICGSSIATAATFSKVSIPEMRRHGYDAGFAAGAVASAGTLGIIIPPSVILAIYSIVAEQSLPKLFAAALIPGLILAALYVITVAIVARLRPELMPRTASMPLGERLRAARGMWKLALLFFLAVVGIYLGWYSPTEAAAVSAFAAIVIAFATGHMRWRGLRRRLHGDRVRDGDAVLHRDRRVHLRPVHRAHPVPDRARRLGEGVGAVAGDGHRRGDACSTSCSARSSRR